MVDAATHLKTRRSIPIPMLKEPGPNEAELSAILEIAARVPDHGKLAPWRFILYRGDAARSIGEALFAIVRRRDGESQTDTRRAVETGRFTRAPLVVGVVSKAAPHVKIPEWEQVLSAGAAAMNLIHAAHAHGYAANWVTEWVAYDDEAKAVLGIAPNEKVVGFIHIGTPTEPPSERPRPALADIVSEAATPDGY
ncbi:nitroreductase family protein [Antarcticirhabdus aurantiaca]|uniref:Nitroreductase n=1 Tax=Antarcticirhabdus aurantiaca TaxID=2606717 RepID=A0ACD4NVB6_9HYPH|nr:nitroreductase [Antarcticirhabdus aurantiaca]WAJ30767.1 nitroreductase [Jeongeuplla avenae]